MTTEEFQRKLTAILSADVVGYSRLMGEDEESTVRTLNKYKEMIFGLIERHKGRLVDSPGDNVLAEFASVVDAVRCGVQIQEDLKANNEELPVNRKMEFRIGIHTGDIIQDGDRIYGDGVNIAARIESLADPGGICVSRTAYDQVKKKLNIDYEYLGEYEVKNIDEPVRVYRIRMEPEVAIPKVHVASNVGKVPKTIAVLPFLNLSSDPEQEHFVDGLSEEIINSLTQIPNLGVTGRTSSFTFKGSNKKTQEIANEIGVENILEGSVRKAGNSLRITAQLVRAADDLHLWSKTYDRELKDIFAVQEDIAMAVADELKVKLGIGNSHIILGGTGSVEAYEHYLVAKGQMWNEDLTMTNRALESLNTALEIDPNFALAWAAKAISHNTLSIFGPAQRVIAEQEATEVAAAKAIELEPNLAEGYIASGFIKMTKGQWTGAGLAYRKALELTDELFGPGRASISVFYHSVGHFHKAHELLDDMWKNDPLNQIARGLRVLNFLYLGEMQRAEEEYERGHALFGVHWWMGTYYMSMARLSPGDSISPDKIVYADSIFDMSKRYLASSEEGIKELRRIYTNGDNLSSTEFFEISIWSAYFGDHDFAMEAIEKAADIEAGGLYHIWLPVMKAVRQTPRFKKFVREIGLVDYWEKFGWPDICHKLDNGDFECD